MLVETQTVDSGDNRVALFVRIFGASLPCTHTTNVSQQTNTVQAASTLIAPALPEIARDLHIKSSVETQLTLSTFILSVAFGPLFFGPLCEIFGRVSGK